MNPKIRVVTALVLILSASTVQAADTVIDQLYGLRNYELADAYWAAGQKFADLGQEQRAAEFKAKAKKLFPGYVPGQAPAVSAGMAAPAAAPAPQVPSTAAVREQNLQGQKIARLQFQKMLRGYLTGSASTMASGLAPSVSLQGTVTPLGVQELEAFLADHPPVAGSPEELFQTATLSVVDGPAQTILLTVNATPESAALDGLVPFWKPSQTYTFDRVGDTWKLVSVEGR